MVKRALKIPKHKMHYRSWREVEELKKQREKRVGIQTDLKKYDKYFEK